MCTALLFKKKLVMTRETFLRLFPWGCGEVE